MKQLFPLVAFVAILVCSSCGGSTSSSKTINGVWRAQLNNADGSSAYLVSASLAQSTGTSVTVSNLTITSPSPCFNAPTGQTATFNGTGSTNGFQTGPFTMTITTGLGTQVENTLALTGTRGNDGNVSGNWTSTGFAGCGGNGTFLMTPPPTP